MNRITLLEQLKEFSKEAVGDMILPVSKQKGDAEQGSRAADIHLMRLPDSSQAKRKRHISYTS